MEEELKKMLDKAESMGYDRGVMTLLKTILLFMEQDRMTVVSYKSLKEIAEGLIKK